MKDPLKAATGVSLGGLFVLFALHGEAFWRGALQAWQFLLAITTTAPIGLASFFMALGLSTMLCIALKRSAAWSANAHARGFWIETIVGIAAMAISWLQLPGKGGIMIGLFAGFMAPYLAKAIMGIATWIRQMVRDNDPPPP